MKPEHRIAISDAVGLLEIVAPYMIDGFAALRFHVTPSVTSNGAPTASSDKRWNVYIHPDIVETVSTPVLSAYILHEFMHPFREHFSRIGDRDPMRWNIAADIEIDDDVEEILKDLDIEAFLNKCWKPRDINAPTGLLAEQYYTMLPPGDSSKSPSPSSSSDSIPRPWEVSDGLTDVESDAIRDRIAEAIGSAVSAGAGNIPGSLIEWATERLRARQPDWYSLLRMATQSALSISEERRKSFFSRSFWQNAYDPFIAKGTVIATAGKIAFCIDTSASVDEDGISIAMDLLRGASEHVELDLWGVDTDAHKVDKVEQMPRYGGTQLQIAIPRVDAHTHYDAIVVVTDGVTDWPSEPTVARLIVLCTIESEMAGIPEWAVAIKAEEMSK